MKPRNKFQKQIAELSRQLPQITDTQKRWAYKNCFEHIARKTQQGKISCLECGGEWSDKSLTAERTVCPHCGTTLTVKETRAYKFKQIEYLCIITKCKGFQVLRFFYIESQTRKGEKAFCYCREVVQRWIAPDGRYATLSMLRPMFCFADYWQWSSELEIRPEKELYDLMPSAVYPRINLTPELNRSGFSGNFHNLTPFEMLHSLLTENRAETLLKIGQTKLLHHFVRSKFRGIDKYWASIRIAIRSGYTIEDGSLWCDYIDLLSHFNRDTHNAKYVCPDNLKLQHDRLTVKREEQQKRERWERQRQKAIENEEHFKELKAKFFGITFTDGEIQVRVLESVHDFFEEATAMKHCVFSNEYYLKENTLIFSATINGNRIET